MEALAHWEALAPPKKYQIVDIRGSVHRGTLLTENPQKDAPMYQDFIIPYFK
jgi:hypothetical protein